MGGRPDLEEVRIAGPAPLVTQLVSVPLPVRTLLSAELRNSVTGMLALPEIRAPYLPRRPLVLQVVPPVLSLPTRPVAPLVLDSRVLPSRRSLLVVVPPLPVCPLYLWERVMVLWHPVLQLTLGGPVLPLADVVRRPLPVLLATAFFSGPGLPWVQKNYLRGRPGKTLA